MQRISALKGSAVAVLAAILVASWFGAPAAQTPATSTTLPPGLTRLSLAGPGGQIAAVARMAGTSGPTVAQLALLQGAGLRVAALRHLPLAVVSGTLTQMVAAVASGAALDIYPNDQLRWLWDRSNTTIRADLAQAAGFNGAGVGVAIVDSGIDATHPALADRVTHNVKIVSPEYLELAGVPAANAPAEPYFPVPVDSGPYNNSDSLSGHGTHVAGIVASNGADPSHPELVGVAPRASLIGYSTGDFAFVITIVAAYDDILEHRAAWNIQVVNNSWGSSFRVFDPDDPIQVATRTVHDAGVVVAFAAGNDSDEATINPYSVAPWVISVGSGTTAKQRSDFSSGGLRFDNASAAAVPADRHLHFVGDALGLYHPDVTAPGTNILSTGTPTGAYVGPTEPGGEAEASGTSMATPQVAGAAAVILQAARAAGMALAPDQVRDVLQVTSTPMADGAPFWQAGFGSIDVKAAVDLVSDRRFNAKRLAKLQSDRNAAVQAARAWSVRASDIWTYQALPATVGGLDGTSFALPVDANTKGLYATVEFPTTPLIGLNAFEYLLTVKDAAGKEVGSTTTSGSAGTGNVLIDLRTVANGVTYGTWTIDVSGSAGASDPNILIGNQVTVTVAQLAPQKTRMTTTTFTPSGTLARYFAAGAATLPLASLEGCATDQLGPDGSLVNAPPLGVCRSGVVGYTVNYAGGIPAQFVSEPLTAPVTIGGDATFVIYLADALQPAWSAVFASGLTYTVFATDAQGNTIPVATGETPERAVVGPTPTRGTYTAAIPPIALPAGVTLTVQFQFSGVYASTMRFVYGGGLYAEAGGTFSTGIVQ